MKSFLSSSLASWSLKLNSSITLKSIDLPFILTTTATLIVLTTDYGVKRVLDLDKNIL